MTVIEVLRNAEFNMTTAIRSFRSPMLTIALSQLQNALKALESGIGPDEEMPEAPDDPR